jgi:hypothetical protein
VVSRLLSSFLCGLELVEMLLKEWSSRSWLLAALTFEIFFRLSCAKLVILNMLIVPSGVCGGTRRL